MIVIGLIATVIGLVAWLVVVLISALASGNDIPISLLLTFVCCLLVVWTMSRER